MARSHANTVRVALWLSSVPTSTYVETLQTFLSDRDVVIATMFRIPGTRTAISGSQSTDAADLLTYARQVFESDPQKNVIFSFHVYYGQWPGWTPAKLDAFALQLRALSTSTGMGFVFGEFGPGRDIGPSPTMLTPRQVIGAAEAAGIGWMGWAWDDNNLPHGASNSNWFSMTLVGPGIYTVPSYR